MVKDFDQIRRAGMLIPCTNTLIEIEFNRYLPKEYQLFTGRLQMGPMSEAGWRMQDADIDYQSRLLSTAGVELIILAQTSASFFDPNYDREVVNRMHEASGVRCEVAGQLIADAVRALGAETIGFVSPYGDQLTAQGSRYYSENHHLTVVSVEPYGQASSADEVAAITQDDVKAAMVSACRKNPDALVVAGGNFATLHMIDQWERDFRRPVLTTNQCTMWEILRAFKHDMPLGFGGRLIRDCLVAQLR